MDVFLLAFYIYWFLQAPNEHQNHNTYNHFLYIPYCINQKFLLCIYRCIQKYLRQSKMREVCINCLLIYKIHYNHILTKLSHIDNFRMLKSRE